MAETSLVDRKIQIASSLLRELDAEGLRVPATFWYYYSEPDEWKLVIASPLVDSQGPIAVYRRIGDVVRGSLKTAELSLSEISVLSPKDPFIKLFKKAIRTGPDISGIRFSRNTINNTYVEDAYIYRME